MDSEDTIKVLRYMEWEKVKGGLRAIMASFTDSSDRAYSEWKELNNQVEEFIKSFGEKAGLD